jgi:hypothetical protein
MECTCDIENDCISTLLEHFSIYTIMVNNRPADFQLSKLTIDPVEVNIGKTVTISVIVTNVGDITGNYEVTLEVNDDIKETKEDTLAGGDEVTVSFGMTSDTAGEYTVNIGGLLGTFNVRTPEVPPVPTPAPEAAPAPANFTISGLSIIPGEASTSEPVAISAVVTNIGGSVGSYTVVLKIDGIEAARREVTLGAGMSETISYTTAKDTEGSYTVDINGAAGQFTIIAPTPTLPLPVAALPVQPPTSWWLIGGIIAGGIIVAAGVLVYFFVWRKRGAPQPS